MGIAKAWKYSGGGVLVWTDNTNNSSNSSVASLLKQKQQQQFCWVWPLVSPPAGSGGGRRRVSWTVVCGVMLFGLGLISLFTGHVASDLEWYSQKLVKPAWYSRLVCNVTSLSHAHTIVLEFG